MKPAHVATVDGTKVVNSVAELLVHAHQLEHEAAERYETLAGRMAENNNPELADLFRQMAAIERKHVAKVDEVAEELELPSLESWESPWEPGAGPETMPEGRVTADITAIEALSEMIDNEERAVRFFTDVADATNDAEVKRLAASLADEEREHIELLKRWQVRVAAE